MGAGTLNLLIILCEGLKNVEMQEGEECPYIVQEIELQLYETQISHL